jgi:hypothetical protein
MFQYGIPLDYKPRDSHPKEGRLPSALSYQPSPLAPDLASTSLFFQFKRLHECGGLGRKRY